MNILIIDGQGGMLGSQLVKEILSKLPEVTITAVGTNAVATASMLKAGATVGATLVNASFNAFPSVCASSANLSATS